MKLTRYKIISLEAASPPTFDRILANLDQGIDVTLETIPHPLHLALMICRPCAGRLGPRISEVEDQLSLIQQRL